MLFSAVLVAFVGSSCLKNTLEDALENRLYKELGLSEKQEDIGGGTLKKSELLGKWKWISVGVVELPRYEITPEYVYYLTFNKDGSGIMSAPDEKQQYEEQEGGPFKWSVSGDKLTMIFEDTEEKDPEKKQDVVVENVCEVSGSLLKLKLPSDDEDTKIVKTYEKE